MQWRLFGAAKTSPKHKGGIRTGCDQAFKAQFTKNCWGSPVSALKSMGCECDKDGFPPLQLEDWSLITDRWLLQGSVFYSHIRLGVLPHWSFGRVWHPCLSLKHSFAQWRVDKNLGSLSLVNLWALALVSGMPAPLPWTIIHGLVVLFC